MQLAVVWRSGLVALAVVVALSTQFFFQAELYDAWPLAEILRGWLDYLLDLLIVGVCVFSTLGVAAALAPQSGSPRHALFLGAIAVGAIGGESVLLMHAPLPADVVIHEVLLAKAARWLVVGGLTYAIYVWVRASSRAAALAYQSDLQRAHIERQMTEARLQALRAQIEPHFLFNTLANVHRLYRTDCGLGRKMLSDFIAYLRAALPQMRSDETTLHRETELARAYLGVLKVRMGERLQFSLDVPDALRELPFPPFALATLTENAVKHGLNPLAEGGSIHITARLLDGRLNVEVTDTGAGLTQPSGSGAGLANLRARLSALYGNAASLRIRANVPRGIRASIDVPVKA